MELIPVKTRIMKPPKDDLYEILDTALHDVREGDIVLITSKVIAIHEGRCVPVSDVEKETLIAEEAEYIFHPKESTRPLTIIHHALISSAGIDESNGQEHYVLLPIDSYVSAQKIHAYLMHRFGLSQVGVVVTDSHSLPFRYGAMSISVGFWGFVPVESHAGRADLFGRIMKYSSTNVVDSLAAASALVCGECDESQPITIARGVPGITFTNSDMREKLLVPYGEDMFRSLFTQFIKREKKD